MPAKAPTGVKNAQIFEANILAKTLFDVIEFIAEKVEANNIDIGILFIMFANKKEIRPTRIIFLPSIKFAKAGIKPLFCKAIIIDLYKNLN